MRLTRRKNRQVGVTDSDVVGFAAQGTDTMQALSKRAHSIIRRGVLSAAVVFVGDFLLRQFFSGGGLVAAIVALVIFGFFFSFLFSLWSWAGFVHLRRLLRANPWVEWYVRMGAVAVAGTDVVFVMVLAHPEWPEEEVRTLHPRQRAAVLLAAASSGTFWAAGNPDRTMAVSPKGGAEPLHALRPPFASLRERLAQAVSTSPGDRED